MERDYTGRNCTEKGLHYTYIGKRLYREETTQKNSIRGRTIQERL